PSFNDSDDLDQLVHGLCLFLGYPSCVCSLKANVNESLQDISKKLLKDFKAVQSCVSITTLTLNCSNCNSKKILCKCCVISCIKELPNKCECVKKASQKCECKGTKEKCCKDFLSGLEACLSMLNLKGDMKGCICKPDQNCCNNGTCTKSCKLCDPSKFPDNAMTGLGICPMNPRKLAEKLEKFFGDKASKTCTCTCGSGSTQNESCCCLACPDGKCLKSCTAKCGPSTCSSHQSSQCPCKTFCIAINPIKIASNSGDMTCCSGGSKCHCQVDKTCTGSNCCDANKSLKCLIRRLVKFFKDFESLSSSKSGCSKLCCELLCVRMHCWALGNIYNKGLTECSKCKENGSGGKCPGSKITSSKECCNGNPDTCQSPNCCLGCQDCNAVKFSRALQKLQYSGPCGLDLYRLLDGLLNFCCNVFWPYVDKKEVKEKIEDARKKCLSGCKSTGGSCQCPSTSSPCKGCQHILQDPQLKVTLAGGYSSSYSSKASWPDCSKSGSKCCGSSPSSSPPCSCPQDCSSGSPSCPSKCCEKCPKRLCAKIFLGMVPCLYWGLKIVFERCDSNNSELWPEWQRKDGKNAKITEASGLRDFLYAWGIYGYLNPSTHAVVLPGLLGNLFSPNSKGSFDKIYDFVSKEYFVPSRSPSHSQPSPPKTVRQMLLWLYGLRFQKHFSDLVSHCKSLCLPFGNSFNSDAFLYYLHLSCFLLPVSFISTIQDSHSHVSTFFSTADSEFLQFSYPEDPSELLEKLCEYVRKIFVALQFLYYQCQRVPAQGGWQFCYYGGSCKKALESSVPSTSGTSSGCTSCEGHETYLCTASKSISNWDVHGKHCAQDKCLSANGSTCTDQNHNDPEPKKKPPKGSGKGKKCSKKCPHPLQRFLTHGSESFPQSQSKDYPFGLSGIVPMGFSQQKLSSTGKSGESLRAVIILFCKSGFYPLTRLAEFSVCVILRPPEFLFELFSFFQKFVSSGVFQNHFASYVDGEPGTYSGSALTTAIKEFYGSWSSHSKSHTFDLYSLHGCDGPKGSGATCGPYLYPLIADAYNIFIENFLGTYLSFVCHLAPTFKEKLEEFHTEFSSSSCCPSGSSCTKIVECPCALPKFYKYGFYFMHPGKLNGGTPKKCFDFIDQLGKVLGLDPQNSSDSVPLLKLLSEIEKFLWSIRFPFFLFILAFWAFVISYFLYVQLYKLDLLHLKSHAHFSRSFKILPSTLFSDASSKLKDLSYFTL
ncbi:variant erythrocyte surface antigen-1 family protein, partial [Babesia divergens]